MSSCLQDTSLMIPGFDQNGNLPRGIHRATLAEIVDQAGFDEFANRIFATDKSGNPRGMIEVIL